MLDADLAHERDYVAGLYARLEELRAEKRRQLAQVRRAGAVGTMQNVSERDAFAALYEDRLAQLDAVDDRLVFGRLDLDSGEAQYIGRIGLTTEDLQRLMVDWRAPPAPPDSAGPRSQGHRGRCPGCRDACGQRIPAG